MSKKNNTGLLIVLGAALGAAAAGISYYLKYKSFNNEIDKDFHDYEEDGAAEEVNDEPVSFNETTRTYITLDANKCKSCENAESCEEPTPEECPAAEDSSAETEEPAKETPTAATVEEDTEGAC